MKYSLHLEDHTGIRIALYDPYNSLLVWKDDGTPLVAKEKVNNDQVVHAISPLHPGKKSTALKKIKVQLGFACNYTCTYCSQNNQRAFSTDTAKITLQKVPAFMTKLPSWFDGGTDGKGTDVHLEFWGGETLLYWSAVLEMSKELRKMYPNIELALFTNGSLITPEMIKKAQELKIHFIISHDGPTFNEDRAKDPFETPGQAEHLKNLFYKLNPLDLVSFNATISPKNYSLLTIRKYIADKLGVDPKTVKLTHDLATPYDKAGLDYVTLPEKRRDLINGIYSELNKQFPYDLNAGLAGAITNDFLESLKSNRDALTVGQKCSMDVPTSIAVDIEGNVLTCQNVTAKGGHKIGHVDDFANVALDTSFHWSTRAECVKCPVVQICKGACMFLKENLWQAACDQHFTWGLSYLAFTLGLLTERKLVKIEGEAIRAANVTSVDVLRS